MSKGKNNNSETCVYNRKVEGSDSEMESDSSCCIEESKKKNNCKYVSYECEHILFFSSFQLSLAFMFSIYCKFYYLAILNAGLFITSILHWRKPELGLRRTVDIIMMAINLLIHAFFSFSINSLCVFIWVSAGSLLIMFYFVGKKFSYNSYSTIYHLLIHTIGNATALAIYYISREKIIDYS
ncbi:conserved Plasmodium protein, unknown function [Plasmodium malariae]|uniref:Uncharacterized protein n=1 Tax=Plasmodium malariae TaxID=5858 RepID=A0A1C3KLF6_PLAMA|nr:conserved Plasmodium protein, unknown function [Plasmodium malariae]